MPYVATNYASNPAAPLEQWVCTRTSSLGPYVNVPPDATRHGPDFCGQCVSFATTVCPTLPVHTGFWKKGAAVKDNAAIAAGTVIATFNALDSYSGHTAIYVSQDSHGIKVYDQWVTGVPRGVHERVIKWNGVGIANNGNGFYVVEP